MDVIARFWSDIGTLKLASAWLQWVSITLVFVSGFLQVGKFLVDRKEKALSAAAQAELLNPVAQLVRGATTTVELVVESADVVNTTYMDSGGYLAFGKAGEPMMILSATQSRARQTGNNEVIWRGVFEMDATDSAVGKPVRFLRDAEFAQIVFSQLARESSIKCGMALVTINNAVRLEIVVPAQKMVEDRILVPNVRQFLGVLE